MAATERKIPGTFAPVPGGYSQQISANTALFIPDFSVSRYDPSTGEVYGYAPDYDALEAAKTPAVQATARRLADYYNAYYRNESACPSILVCGGSNFPVRKKQKQNARRESLWQEYKDIDAILDKIRSVGTGAVDLADPHARELLQDRLQQEQNALDYCKAANAYYRKHKTLRGYASLTDEQADAITDPEAFSIKLYGKPYGDFELSSLRGKIKRVQARLADLDKLQAAAQQPDNTTKFDGGEIVRNAEENRLQILFDEIPDADTRDALKSNGFRWSPRNNAWQRQLTQNAEYAARRVLGL